MALPKLIEFENGFTIPILYEDRNVIAIDKPAGWLLVPNSWDRTQRNLQLAIESSINAGDYWASSRKLRYLRYVHRLDGETSGVLLFAKHPNVLQNLSELFEEREVKKTYLAVIQGVPKLKEWTCTQPLSLASGKPARARVDLENGQSAETHFKVLQSSATTSLVEAHPLTGRTHQIRIHLTDAGHQVLGDELYGQPGVRGTKAFPLALRAVSLAYHDSFQRWEVKVVAPTESFCKAFGFTLPKPVRKPEAAKPAPTVEGKSKASSTPKPPAPPRE